MAELRCANNSRISDPSFVVNDRTSARFLMSIKTLREFHELPRNRCIKRNGRAFSKVETQAFAITHGMRQENRLLEIHSHFLRRMGIGTERDGYAALKCEREKFAA